MAYTEPVVGLIIDSSLVATTLGYSADYYEDNYDAAATIYDDLDALQKLTGCTELDVFTDEGSTIVDFGLEIDAGFYVAIDQSVFAKEAALRAKYSHPLIRGAQLAVVSRFC